MSDSIMVRVTLGSFDIVRPSEKQTQVYVQIPEVVRASWLLPEDHFSFSKSEPWPSVVDSAQEYYAQSGMVSDPVSAAARAAVVKWLMDDANHDAMQAAWELDEARRHPVARKLLRVKERLSAELEQRSRDLADTAGERDGLRARVAELEKAAEQIRFLHKDSPMGPCPVCVDADAMGRGEDPTVPYPCPTARLAGAKACDPPSADRLTRLLAPTQALRDVPDGEHYAAVHHDYRTPHDLPETGGDGR